MLKNNYSRKIYHNHRKLIKLITWTTALFNSMKLWAMPCRPPKTDGGEFWQHMIHWRKEWQTTSVFCLENPMNSMIGQKDRPLKDELPRSVSGYYATGIRGEITPERMKRWSQSKNNTQLWMWLVIEARSDVRSTSWNQDCLEKYQ